MRWCPIPILIKHNSATAPVAFQAAGNVGQFDADRQLFDDWMQQRAFNANRDDNSFARRMALENQDQQWQQLDQQDAWRQDQAQIERQQIEDDYTRQQDDFYLRERALQQKPILQDDSQQFRAEQDQFKESAKWERMEFEAAARGDLQAQRLANQQKLQAQRNEAQQKMQEMRGTQMQQRDTAAMERTQYVQQQMNQRQMQTEQRLATARDDRERAQILDYEERTLNQDVQRFAQEANRALQMGDQNQYNAISQMIGSAQNPAPGSLLAKINEVRARKQQFLQGQLGQPQQQGGAFPNVIPQTQPAAPPMPPQQPPGPTTMPASPDPGGRVFQSPSGRQYTVQDIMETSRKYGIPPEEVIRRAGLR